MGRTEIALPAEYASTLDALKARVSDTRNQARRTVNTQLIELYWHIGDQIRIQQENQGWGTGVIRRLAEDLRAAFPDMTGFSYRNLQYMRSFAALWAGAPIVQQPAAQLPWGHNMVLIDKINTTDARAWCASAAVKHGWSRNGLINIIMNQTMERTGAAPSNFISQLASPDSELAQQVAKDPYAFEFLGLSAEVAERDLEQALMDRIVETLRELGPGFTFVGRQVHFDVGGDDFYLDLLFFHVEQLRYVVVELKTGKFQPEYTGKLQFYITLVDGKLRRPTHSPTVGILICGSRNDHTVRYALNQSNAAMAVSTYTYDTLPADERHALPNEDELAAALEWAEPDVKTPDSTS